MLGNIEGGRRRGQERMGWLDGITDSMNMNLGKRKLMSFKVLVIPSELILRVLISLREIKGTKYTSWLNIT